MRRLASGLLAGVLLLSVAACQDDPPPDDDGITRYVALGDSYTAAPGVPVTDPADPCQRSDSNYPSLIADELPRTALVDVSCSGANIAHVTEAKDEAEGVGPQLDAVSEDTDLVTIGIGGNNGKVFYTWATQCLGLAASDPQGSPCADANKTAAGDVLLKKVAQVRKVLTAAIEAIQEQAPDATVILVTYPQILPDRGTCPDLFPYAAGDYAYINSIVAAQNDAIVSAAKEAGADWVNVEKASRGHDICAKEPWVNGLGAGVDQSEGNWLHPFAVEQAAVAKLIMEKL